VSTGDSLATGGVIAVGCDRPFHDEVNECRQRPLGRVRVSSFSVMRRFGSCRSCGAIPLRRWRGAAQPVQHDGKGSIMRHAAWLLLLLFAWSASAADPQPSARRRSEPRAVGPRDFFLYGCVREYAKAHSLPVFDDSTGYAVEYSTMGPEEMSRLYDAAKQFARTLRAPDLADEEHGGVAVLALCLEESRSPRVGALIGRTRKK
jgi:hypothetical protein